MKTVEQGIRASWESENGLVGLYDFQPGNGTRYVLAFTKVPFADEVLAGKPVDGLARVSDAMGIQMGGWLLTWENTGRSMTLSRAGGTLVASHVQTRLKCSRPDALQILRLIQYATARKVEMGEPSEYEG